MSIKETITYIVFMIILVMISALFSATETAFSASSRSKLRAMDTPKSERTLKVLERYDDLLSTILIGNNIVNIGLASMGAIFFVAILGNGGASVSTVVITIAVLVFGEVTPKGFAMDMPERVAIFMTPIMELLIFIMTPLNAAFRIWRKMIERFLPKQDDIKTTSEELLVLVEEAEQEGAVDKEEGELLRSAIEFSDREAQDILTHRVDLEAVPCTADRKMLSDSFIESRYSRILVYEESIDNIVGVVHLKDFYRACEEDTYDLQTLMTKPIFVPPTLKIDDLLRLLQQQKSSIAVVTDEYGGTLGIVSVEDCVEELVGEIWDEHDEVEEDYRQLEDSVWLVSGKADLEKTFEMFDTPLEEELEDIVTVSGWVMEELGKIPEIGDSFAYKNLQVMVTETDSRRVVTIQITILSEEDNAEGLDENSTAEITDISNDEIQEVSNENS